MLDQTFIRFIAQQELRSKREKELATLKKNLEDEAGSHEAQLTDMRHKHSQELSTLSEQLENLKKVRVTLEKARQTLEAENADLATELRNVNTARQENDRRRKQAETQIAELQVTLLKKKIYFCDFVFSCKFKIKFVSIIFTLYNLIYCCAS